MYFFISKLCINMDSLPQPFRDKDLLKLYSFILNKKNFLKILKNIYYFHN